MHTKLLSTLAVGALAAAAAVALDRPVDPLPSWNDGDTKAALLAFVEKVTDEGGPGFVPAAERVAVFDNDGTLWAEQPLYFQALYALDRIRELAPEHPEWQESEAFRCAIAGDVEGLLATGKESAIGVLAAAHSDVTAEEFRDSVADWFATAKHPGTGMAYVDMVYQPMLELLDHLRANDFEVFIVSGGGIDFLRVFAEERYGIPPENVVGTTGEAHFELRDGIPTIVKDSEISLVDDKAGKPVGIHRHIGRRPILASGNSDGDLQMLQYTTIPRSAADTRPRLGLLLHHTDAEREWAYDRESHVGTLAEALDQAPERGWTVVDMKADWKRIYPD